MRQQRFKDFGVSRGHSNLGMDFQAEIDAANSSYRARLLIDVERNPNEWKFTTMADYHRLKAKSPSMCAVTGSGRFMVMVQSKIDYMGLARTFSLAFDAKETGKASIPLENFGEHQIGALVVKENCGVRAGFLIRFSRDDSVYWIGAKLVQEAYDRAKYQPKGKATHPKSLSPDWLAEHGKRVESERVSMVRVDYLRAVAPEVFK